MELRNGKIMPWITDKVRLDINIILLRKYNIFHIIERIFEQMYLKYQNLFNKCELLC